MEKQVYRIPLVHCVLACIASFVLGIGLTLTYPSFTKSANTPKSQEINPFLETPKVGQDTKTTEPDNRANITLYFNNVKFNPNAQDCGAVYPVIRRVQRSNAPLQATVDMLFAGPTIEEKSLGYDSLFSEKTKDMLKSVNFKEGTVFLDFNKAGLMEAVKAGANSSCGSAQFAASIQKTLMGVVGVKTVDLKDFSVEGSKPAFKNLLGN